MRSATRSGGPRRPAGRLTGQDAGQARSKSGPPSTDPPGARPGRGGKPKGKRRRGGQHGHRGSRRELVPVERVDDVVDFFPSHCEHCSEPLPPTPDPMARRFQMTELPAFEPHTTEYRRHEVKCRRCNGKTLAPYDAKAIPSSPFGARLMSAIALLTGVYHLSRRKAVELPAK